MIKPRFTKLLCMLLTLLLLLAPAAAFAEGESPIKIGDQPECSVTMPNVSLDIGGELYLNGISYEAQLNLKGYIVVRNVDLTAAKRAAEAIADYETQHNSEKFTATANMKIVSGYGLKVLRSELPDLKNAATEIESMEFPEELSDDSTQRLAQALTALEQNLSTKGDENYSDNIQSILQLFSVSDTRFNENMTDVYQLLFDIRAAIACGTLPQSILTDETTTNLLTIFRDILEKGGVDLDEIEFWENDEDWVVYAAKESNAKLDTGDKFVISDKAGKSIMVSVKTVVPDPPSPDEYAYEPPPPMPPRPRDSESVGYLTIICEVVDDGDEVVFIVNEENNILFSVSGAPDGATYKWKCVYLPSGLDLVFDKEDSSYASITGKPDSEGKTNVIVSAETDYDGTYYIDYHGFTIKVIEAIDEELTGVSAPQLLTTSTAPLPADTSDATDATDTTDPSTLSTPSTLTSPVDTTGTVDPSTPSTPTETDDTTDPATPTDHVGTTEPADPETPEAPEA